MAIRAGNSSGVRRKIQAEPSDSGPYSVSLSPASVVASQRIMPASVASTGANKQAVNSRRQLIGN